MILRHTKLVASLMAILALVLPVSAYTIDGDLSDWGVTPFSDWVPDSATADYTESNWAHSPDIGTGSIPSGGETFDIEAIYFDDDGAINASGKAYFAVVSSMPETPVWSAGYVMGDLALDIDNDGAYEYGIKVRDPNKGMVCHNPNWVLYLADPTAPGYGYPYTFTCDGPSSNLTGYADLVYVNVTSTNGESGSFPYTYVIEMAVWKAFLGSPSQYQLSRADMTISCGNDLIGILYDWDFPAPAFPAAAVPLGIVLFAPVAAYMVARKED